MNKLLLIDKPKGHTSRDVVNIATKVFKTKKVGHFGTLDPLATGLLVLGVGKFTKLGNLFSSDTKEYIATVLVGVKTDTYDVTGNVLLEKDSKLDRDDLLNVLNSFKKTYLQEVPIYSSVKVNGKKLYEYARNNEKVILPKKEVTIYDIELIDIDYGNNMTFTFRTLVSKGTYIRSLINDIGNELGIPLTMMDLRRTKQDKFLLEDADTIDSLKENRVRLYDIEDIFDIEKREIDDNRILNGNVISSSSDMIIFTRNGENYVLYKKFSDDKMKPFLYF